MKKYKLELSLSIGLALMLLFCTVPQPNPAWWSVAFSPLCDGILTADSSGDLILRSRLFELILQLRKLF